MNGAGVEQGFIYFIGPEYGDDGPIKIGWSRDPRRRLTDLQTANHEDLRIWTEVRGTVQEEREIHALLADHRVRPRGEWYHLSPEVKFLLWALYGWNQNDPPDMDAEWLRPFFHLIDRADGFAP